MARALARSIVGLARVVPILVLWLVVIATFGSAVFGTYVYDDQQLLVANPVLAGEAGWWAVVAQPLWGPAFPHWRPLTQVLLAVGNGYGGAFGVHLLALAAHMAAVAVAYRLAARLTDETWVAFSIALWFGVHPAQVESVAWCAALNDVLWGLFALCALAVHAADRDRGGTRPSWRVVVFFALALSAKETALVVPFLLVLLDPTCWRRGWRFLVVLGPWVIARGLVYGDWLAGFDRGPSLDLGGRSALWLSGEIFGRLVGVLVWPFWPDAMRPMPVEGGPFAVGFVLLAVGVVVAVVVTHLRGVALPAVGLGVIALVLAMHAVSPRGLGEYPIADRYLYLPVFGLALACVPVLARWRRIGWVAWPIAVAFAVTSFVSVDAWAGQRAFVQSQLARGDDARVHYMAGQLALEREPRDLEAARAHLARAAELASARRHGGEEGRLRLQVDIATGQAWCLFFLAERSPQPDFRAAAEIFARNLDAHETHVPSHVGLAVCLAAAGDLAAAERHLLRALELEPNQSAARANLARVRSLRRR